MRFSVRGRRRAVWSAGVAILIVGGLAVAFTAGRGGDSNVAAATTTTVQRGIVSLAVSASGTVQSAQTRGLGFSVAGTVTEVNVKAGDLVSTGQVLARIDDADTRDAFTSAQSRVEDAQDAADRAEETASLPLCPSASPSTEAAPSGTAQPPAEGAGAAGGSDGTGGTGGAGTTQACTSAPRGSTADSLLSAQQQLNNAKLALKQAEARLAGTVITAPIDGKVLSVGGRVGSTASPDGTGFVVLSDVATLAVEAPFSEADVGRIAVGQTASIRVPGGTAELAAKVSQIDPAGTVTNRLVTYGVVIAFDAVPADLLLGQSATVTVITAEADDVLYVMSAAITDVVNGTGNVTVRVGGRDEIRTVGIGLRGDQYTQVTTGLAEGEEVVLSADA